MKTMPALLVQKEGLTFFLPSFKGTILISKSVYQSHKELFKDREVILYDYHQEPTTPIAYQLKLRINNHQPLLAIGGGSVLDIAKILTLQFSDFQTLEDMLAKGTLTFEASMPLTLVPTTSGSGSEASSVAVLENSQRIKQGFVDDRFLPKLAILDASLLMTLPITTLRYSAADAITHAIESFLSLKASNLSQKLSLWALDLLLTHYPRKDSVTFDSLESLLFGSHLAGLAFNIAGTAAIHALAYPLGADTKLPHGLVNGLLLPPTLKRYLEHPASKEIEELIDKHIGGIAHLASFLALEVNYDVFKNISLSDFQRFATDALNMTRLMQNSPVAFDTADLISIYQDALLGVDNDS